MIVKSYEENIEAFHALDWMLNNYANKNSKKDYFTFLLQFKNFIYSELHERLAKDKSNEAEQQRRDYCKYVIDKLLPITKKEIKSFDKKLLEKTMTDQDWVMYNQWLDLDDDFMALASYRSLMHLAMYLETDDNEEDKVWKYTMDTAMGGIFYYSERMILDNDHQLQNLIKQCPPGYGKCVSEDTEVLTSNGYKKIKDLNVGDYVKSMKDNILVDRPITNIWHTKKTQVKIKTRCGKEIIISPEHRMYTQRGYVMAKDLTSDDYLYLTVSNIENSNSKSINEDELTFISGMIFDGTCMSKCIQFCKPMQKVTKAILESASNLGLPYHCVSYKKNIEYQFYFETNENTRFSTGITLANKKLIDDIQKLLLSCNIYSIVSYKNSKIKNKSYDAWTLTIPNEYLQIIQDNCYCYDKQDNLDEILKKNNYYSISTSYPKEVLEHCKEFKQERNKHWNRNKTYKREIVEEFNRRTHLLDDVIYKDFVYDKIISIEYSDVEIPMIDIEVEETHNFIANNYVSHNSKSDCVIMCFIFGYNINADMMKVVGNPAVIQGFITRVTTMLKSKKFGKVFPVFGKYKGSNDMFSEYKVAEGAFTLKEANVGRSFYLVNKKTPLDGTRYNYQFYDDVTQSKDMYNLPAHEKDIDDYDKQWEQRKQNENTVLRWFTGTAYHNADFISYIKSFYSYGKPLIVDMNTAKKYKWAKFCKLSYNSKTAYIIVPGLADLNLGRDECYSTFPEKFSKEYFLNRYDNKRDNFLAMIQQEPVPPESLYFAWVRLQQYTKLPRDIQDNNCESVAIIDPSRKGRDNYTCLIFKKSTREDKYYLVDAFYKQVSSKVALPKIGERIAHHKVDKIYYEGNVTDLDLFEEKLNQQIIFNKWQNYSLIPFYSEKNKEQKIQDARDEIRDQIIFPIKGMYHKDSDMGRAMEEITNYNFDGKNIHDDAVDCCSMLIACCGTQMDNEIICFSDRI